MPFKFLMVLVLVVLLGCTSNSQNEVDTRYSEVLTGELFGKILHDPYVLEALSNYLHFNGNATEKLHFYFNDFEFNLETEWSPNTGVFKTPLCESLLEDDSTQFYIRAEGALMTDPRKFESCHFRGSVLKKALETEADKWDNITIQSTSDSSDKLIIRLIQPQKTKNSYYQLIQIYLKDSPAHVVNVAVYLDVNDLGLKYYEVNPSGIEIGL